MSFNDKIHNYTLLLSSKAYIFNKETKVCSDVTDIMFASFFVLKKYFGDNDDPKDAKINSNFYNPWLEDKRMNFIILQKSFSVFPLPNGIIEIKVFDNKKINEEIIKKEIYLLLKNLKNGFFFSQHSENLKKQNILTAPGYRILSENEKKTCKEFYNIVFENHNITKKNLFIIFFILMIGIYFLILSINLIKKNKLFS